MSFLKRHLPVLRTFTIILALLFSVGGSLAAFERDADAIQLDSSGWRWSPATSWDESPPADGWRPYTAPVEVAQKLYWLRVPLPAGQWKDPALFILHAGDNRAYADGKIIYEDMPARNGVRVNSGFYWHMFRLPLQLSDHVDLLMRNGTLSTQNPSIELGEKASFVNRSLHKDLDNIILGGLLIFSCLVSIGFYVSHREKLYLYFALLAFAGGYASFVGNQLIKFLWSSPWISFLQETAMPWATFAVVGALEQVFPGINGRALKTLRRIVLWFSVLATAGAFVSVYFYTFWTSYLYLPIFLSMFVISYWTIWKAYRTRRDLESIWVMAGFTSLVAIAFVHVIRYWLPPNLYEWWPGLRTYLVSLPEDLIYLGLFAFVICLIRIIIYRYTAMNRQLTELNRSLEQLVASRIEEIRASNSELEVANERLAASQKESAEAMAESMMLEERHRITGAIHDTVGHTLSAAIIQLEAARRLLPLDRPQAEEKLEASQNLARQGLEDIRHSVRLLRDDLGHFDLPGAIGALIRDAEQRSGCRVDCRIGPLPLTLSAVQKRVLFQALQEGLALGLKHGSSKRFEFELEAESGAIRFLLIGDGKTLPEHELGLGLKAVTERVSRLGGELRLQSSSGGAVLFLSMPA